MTDRPVRYLVVELDDSPEYEDVPIPELLIDGEVIEPESIDDRIVRYTVAEGTVGTPQLRFAGDVMGASFLEPYLALNYDAAVPLRAKPMAGQKTETPQPSTFRTRVSYSEAEDVTRPGLATSPPESPPINGVATMTISTFLDSDCELRSNTDWDRGWLHEFETYCEPLGWALDEWVDTTSLAPFEDEVRSFADLHNVNRASQDARTAGEESSIAGLEAMSAVNESTRLSTRQDLRTRQFEAGLSGSPAEAAATAANPIAKIIQSLTGTLQVGYSAASARSSAESRGDLARVLNNQVEQATTRARSINARALADLEGTISENRRLSALKNLGGDRALNVASFSLARQWKVSTVEARKRRIVFVRVNQLDKPFDAEEIFVHRATLVESLLDPELHESLKLCASRWHPVMAARSPNPEVVVDDVTVRQARVSFDVTNPAKGRNAEVIIAAGFRNADNALDLYFDEAVDASDRHSRHEISIQINQPLRRLAVWTIVFRSDARLFRDWNARLSNLTINLDLVDSSNKSSVLRVDTPLEVALRLGDRRYFPRGVPDVKRDDTVEDQQADVYLARLLAHLNANRTYYRCAIDLQRDPIARFIDFSARAPGGCMPADMRPAGVAGAHVAYLSEGDPEPITNGANICQLIATPAFGLYQEVVQGKGQVVFQHGDDKEPWPKISLGANETIPWPPAMQVTPLSATAAALDPLAAADTQKPAEAGPSELLAKLQALQDSVTALAEKLKPNDQDAETEDTEGEPKPSEAPKNE